ncbi:unnamed protein product [Sphenostylis stenocarpa]|uniref:Uncharacterized protein n=1 Tax=Sphenostylis stenocarpa TaxID=92480 RepID=A0AA86SKG1_9FABA|nr:unnamed protein product [Sphenostylis stenocarpa]
MIPILRWLDAYVSSHYAYPTVSIIFIKRCKVTYLLCTKVVHAIVDQVYTTVLFNFPKEMGITDDDKINHLQH